MAIKYILGTLLSRCDFLYFNESEHQEAGGKIGLPVFLIFISNIASWAWMRFLYYENTLVYGIKAEI